MFVFLRVCFSAALFPCVFRFSCKISSLNKIDRLDIFIISLRDIWSFLFVLLLCVKEFIELAPQFFFCCSKWVSWNKQSSVELTFCGDSDQPNQVSYAKCVCFLVYLYVTSWKGGFNCSLQALQWESSCFYHRWCDANLAICKSLMPLWLIWL